MKRTLQAIIVCSFVVALVSCAAKRPTTTAPASASSVQTLLSGLLSTDTDEVVQAHRALVNRGEDVLPELIEEMNKPDYLSHEQNTIKKLGDPRWINRMRLAGVIQDISQQDFSVRTTAHGWDPDYSFDLINTWWKSQPATEGH